jgi:heptosyltransferase III
VGIIRLRLLGDMVMLTPALAALHAWRPDLRLSVVTEPAYRAILEGNPAVAEILVFRSLAQAVPEMRRRHFSIVFNQHSGPTSALLTAASGAPVRVCWEHRQLGFVYNVNVPGPQAFYPREDDVHTVKQRMTQFYHAGLPMGPIPPAVVYPQRDAIEFVNDRLVQEGLKAGQPYVLLRPGATNAAKRWAVENFAEIARWLRETRGATPVVNLGPGDEEIAADVYRLFAPHSVVIDRLDLRQLIALIAGARLLVGNDTGPTHIAAATGRPIVVIFGASNPVHWKPWAVPHRLIQSADPKPGLHRVTVAEVRAACEELLAKAPAAGGAITPAPRTERGHS